MLNVNFEFYPTTRGGTATLDIVKINFPFVFA